jgi:hypothetical protein
MRDFQRARPRPGSLRNEEWMKRLSLVCLGLVLAGGCVGPKVRAAAPHPQRNLLTREEILNSTYRDLDLYQTVRALRPNFLEPPPAPRSRATNASLPTAVYVNKIRQTDIAALRTLRASDVEEVRYLDPTASQSELGPTAAGGALIVKLRKPAPNDDVQVELVARD